jgi:hypothetical protein
MSAAASTVLDLSVISPDHGCDWATGCWLFFFTAGTPEKQDTHCIQRCDDVGFYIFFLQLSERPQIRRPPAFAQRT